jgi:malonyl-CoA O-methyltransferase
MMDGGLLMAADLGPTSLTDLANGLDPQSPEGRELAAWRAARLDLHDLGDALSAARLAEPVMESESLTLTYRSEQRALDDLQALGLFLGQSAQAWSGTLTRLRAPDGLMRLTLEVVIGHAWRMPSRKPKLDPQDPIPIRFARRN